MRFSYAIWLAFLSIPLLVNGQIVEDTISVNPQAMTTVIRNPGVGVERFMGNKLPLAQYPATGIEYYRFYWSDIEPLPKQYNFALLDNVIANIKASGKYSTIALRFMLLDGPEAGSKIPQWLINRGIEGEWTEDYQTFIPDLTDPQLQYYLQRLLNAYGDRYDGSPYFERIEVGLVGSWGEWHLSNFPSTVNINQRYSAELLNKYIQFHYQAFPITPKMLVINAFDKSTYGLQKGAGWRADCLGDWSDFSDTWSHMNQSYPESLISIENRFEDFEQQWQHAPVSFESCYNMQFWFEQKHYSKQQIKATLDWALQQHATSINFKSIAIPPSYRPLLDDALLKLGYRIRLAAFEHTKRVHKGNLLTINAQWFNEGGTPAYLPYYLTYQITDNKGEVVLTQKTEQDLRDWLPGEIVSTQQIKIPATLKVGQYTIKVAFVNSLNEAVINLSIVGRDKDKPWYTVSQFEVD